MFSHLRRALVLLLLVLAPISVAGSPAWACSCATGFDPLERSEVAFVGVVEDVDADWVGSDVEVEFAVESVLKGDPGSKVTLITAEDSASCGYGFVEGGRYQVYSVGGATSSCDGNELLARMHREVEDRTRIFWVGSALVLVAVAGGLGWLIRHPRKTQ
ncbi:hypothetical protein [Actinoplanes derwentensis]|uniref:Tissue inhibitor of metalloproteinase n=1 Tax=Actinoplanes derwentensis TaxID=113562 RepID=A0A1H2CT56_9ACTN|nr:hypothetical protein [Actinoplanes derwentensis]GID89746.1 hypothetical protein Ade03nite_86700 [Actinoplanes derwentensis]SDT73663.1 hypothetical protein SAMN04489716_6742 [Actinoplanes derwentensis]